MRSSAIAVGFASLLAACGSSTTEATEDRKLAADLDRVVVESPIERFLEAEIGLDRAAVSAIWIDEWADAVRECMASAGYQLTAGEVMTSKDQLELESRFLTDFAPRAARRAIADLTAPETDPTPEAEEVIEPPDDPRRRQQRDDCQNAARRSHPSPLEDFNAWLNPQVAALTSRIESDGRMQAARAAGTECIRQLGFSASATHEVVGSFQGQVAEILEAHERGMKSHDATLVELRVIAAEETRIEDDLNQCAFREYQVLYDLIAEVEAEFVEAQSEALRERALELKLEIDRRL